MAPGVAYHYSNPRKTDTKNKSSGEIDHPNNICCSDDARGSPKDLSVMTIGSDRRCRRPKRSTSPRDEARSPHMDARKKIKSKPRTKFRVQFLSSPGWRRLLTVTYYHPGTTISMYLSTLPSSFHV